MPYDFRIPTPRKLLQAFWNPDSGNIFSEQPFGVGWTVNFGALLPMLRGLIGSEETRRRRPDASRIARQGSLTSPSGLTARLR